MSDLLPITAIVHTRNSGETLERCLDSIPAVAQLLVVDMNSSDDSVKIARAKGAEVISVDDAGYVEPARATALAAAKQPWILIVDADEALPEAVKTWLPELIATNAHSVYSLPRRNTIFGKPLTATGWWPDYQVRLFKAGSVTWPEKIHSQPETTEKSFKLPATDEYALSHLNYQHIAQFIDRMNRYTTIEAQTNPTAKQEDQWLLLQTRELFSRLGALEGWRDKEQGLSASLLQSFYPLVSALKRWEAQGFTPNPSFDESLEKQLDIAVGELRYWRATIRIQNTTGVAQFLWRIRRKLQL